MVFVNDFLGNEAQTLREHLPQLRQPTCSLNSHIGLNHDGVIARRGIVFHHLREEKPRESFSWYLLTNSLGMKPRLCGNISLGSGNLLAHLILILL